jgi:hypothetical protein
VQVDEQVPPPPPLVVYATPPLPVMPIVSETTRAKLAVTALSEDMVRLQLVPVQSPLQPTKR